MVKVKICGITNLEDALSSADAGCDALGFVFYKNSRRYITPYRAAQIIKALPKKIIKVGVFVNGQESQIRWVAKLCNLNFLQFHGDESPEFVQRFKDYKVIKALRIRRKRDLRNILRYKPFAFLFDTYSRLKIGGTGERFNWELVRHIDGINRPVFLAGGLTYKNAKEAIETAHPDWLDVSSSVEMSPGKKDPEKVRKFIEAAKQK